jgi:hypothetical protein
MVFIVSAAVALLSTRFLLQADWIKVILLPYSTFGIAVTALLPLIIYFYFVESISSSTIRKMAWIFAAVVFVGLWYTRYDEITSSAIYVYPVAAVACFVFLAFDGTIRRAWNKARAENALSPTRYVIYNRLKEETDELMKAQRNFTVGSKGYNDIQKHVDDNVKKMQRIIP